MVPAHHSQEQGRCVLLVWYKTKNLKAKLHVLCTHWGYYKHEIFLFQKPDLFSVTCSPVCPAFYLRQFHTSGQPIPPQTAKSQTVPTDSHIALRLPPRPRHYTPAFHGNCDLPLGCSLWVLCVSLCPSCACTFACVCVCARVCACTCVWKAPHLWPSPHPQWSRSGHWRPL